MSAEDTQQHPATARQQQERQEHQPDPLLVLITGYLVGALLRGDLELSLIEMEAATYDNRSTFVVEGKKSRKRMRITVREERE